MLIFGYRRPHSTPGCADKLSYRSNVRYSICLHSLECHRTDTILKKALSALKTIFNSDITCMLNYIVLWRLPAL